MRKPTALPAPYVQPYRYPSPNIPLAAIRRFARRIAKQFQPRKIILFGSYAYGKPHAESDVDLLVVMLASDVVNMAIRISLAFERVFSMDLLVRTPEQMERGVKDNDWFLREIVEKGKVVYEAKDADLGAKRGRLGRGVCPTVSSTFCKIKVGWRIFASALWAASCAHSWVSGPLAARNLEFSANSSYPTLVG
jgi:predicted nucleotidyltransferase